MPRGTWEIHLVVFDFVYGALTLYGCTFQNILLSSTNPVMWLPQHPDKSGFRLIRFRSPLLTESHMISFPPVTKMFQFTGCPSSPKGWDSPTFIGLGYPIRKPTVGNVCLRTHRCYRSRARVLLRLKLPRHPPLA